MRSQIKVGSVFGIKVGLHYSWFLIAFLILLSLADQFHRADAAWSQNLVAAMAVTTTVFFFISLLLHELAHSLVASRNGLPVSEITLFALGGVSQIEKNPTSATLEFWMAFVGPLTSAFIGAACYLAARLNGGPQSSPLNAMLLWLGYINLALAGFNLIPGYPLDGGRVLRALIWWKTGDAGRSTRLSARAGQIVAFFFIAYGIFQFFGGDGIDGLWIAFIGWFLLQASRESYLQVSFSQTLIGVRAADVMSRDCPVVDTWLNIQNFVDNELLRTGRRCFVVVDRKGGTEEIVGMITPHEIKQVERARWPYTTLSDVMLPLENLHAVTPDTPLQAALETMGRFDLNQLPVISGRHLEGVLSRANVLNFIRTRAEIPH